jgi:phage tail-like protein
MARSSRADVLEKFRFLISFSDSTDSTSETTALDRAGFFEVQMPKRSTNKIQYREGNDPDIYSLSAGLSTMEDITLSRGLIARAAGATGASPLYTWMSSVHKPTPGIGGYLGGASPKKTGSATGDADNAQLYRKTITISILNREGVVSRKYELYQAMVVNFVPGSDMNAGEDGDKMLESVTIAYEDFKEVAVA